jgi:hypothetical protein
MIDTHRQPSEHSCSVVAFAHFPSSLPWSEDEDDNPTQEPLPWTSLFFLCGHDIFEGMSFEEWSSSIQALHVVSTPEI